MAIPNNLLPINNPKDILDVEESLPTVNLTRLPSNLLPVNASDISGSFQSLAGNIPTVDAPQIPQFAILNTAIPDRLFNTGSIDDIRTRTTNAARTYISGLPTLPTIPTIPTLTIPPVRIPSYGQIKNYINTKINRIKQQKQKASIKALENKIIEKQNPFAYRQSLINKQQEAAVQRRITNQ